MHFIFYFIEWNEWAVAHLFAYFQNYIFCPQTEQKPFYHHHHCIYYPFPNYLFDMLHIILVEFKLETLRRL